jgi:membrane-associated phospholipid phosphatase
MNKRWIALIVLFSGGILSTFSYLLWDKKLVYLSLQLNMFFLELADVITQAGDAFWYYVLLIPAFVLVRFVWKNETWSGRILYMILSLMLSGIFSTGLKWLAGRHRPINLLDDGLFGFNFFMINFIYESTSFPSGHAVTAFALATAIGFLYPRQRIVAFVVAGLIAVSRVVLRAHYLSDVIAGAVIGILCSLGMKYLFDRFHFDLNENG